MCRAAYINITGNLIASISFRITPDITRESGVAHAGRRRDSVTNDSLVFRIKYAYAQFNLDDWMTKGSWVADRHPADAAARLRRRHLPLPVPGHDVHRARRFYDRRRRTRASRSTTTSRRTTATSTSASTTARATQARAQQRQGVRHPRHGAAVRASRRRCCGAFGRISSTTSTTLRAGRRAQARDGQRDVRTSVHQRRVRLPERQGSRRPIDHARGRSQGLVVLGDAEAIANGGREMLLRYDHFTPNTATWWRRPRRRRSGLTTAEPAAAESLDFGVAYWFPHQGSVTSRYLLDYDGQMFNNIIHRSRCTSRSRCTD